MIAAQAGRQDNIELLLDWDEKKAEEQDDDGTHDPEVDEVLVRGAKRNPKSKAVPYINAKAKGTQYTALHFAVCKNQLEAVRLLIERDANIEAPDATKMRPLHHAAAQGHLEIVQGTPLLACDVGSLLDPLPFLISVSCLTWSSAG